MLPVISDENVVHAVRLVAHGPSLLVCVLLNVSRHALQCGPSAVPAEFVSQIVEMHQSSYTRARVLFASTYVYCSNFVMIEFWVWHAQHEKVTSTVRGCLLNLDHSAKLTSRPSSALPRR